MAYDQGYYQQPQRPYNGGADRRPGPQQQGYGPPTQNYPPPTQNYPPQQYDQYPQEEYQYDDYGNGNAQEYGQEYQDYNGGGGRGNYPPQERGYPPPQQDYYGGGRGGMPPPRGGGGRGGPGSMQRPPTADSMRRGGFEPRGGGAGRGGYPNGSPAARGGSRPPPLERGNSSESGQSRQGQIPRKPMMPPQLSPEQAQWDSPFPTFPGAKKKTAVAEEQEILQKMTEMEIGVQPQPQKRPRTAGSKNSTGRAGSVDDYGGRPSMDSQRRGPTPDDYGRPDQRNMPPRGYPPQANPQQSYGEPRRPPLSAGYGPPPRQNAYDQPGYADRGYDQTPRSPSGENFGPPTRSMTMPNGAPLPRGPKPPMPMMDETGFSAPYNGPIGRDAAPRPNTASGNRAPPSRQYPNQGRPMEPYVDSNQFPNAQANTGRQSVSDLYDDYYGGEEEPAEIPPNNGYDQPRFDESARSSRSHRRGSSLDNAAQPNNGQHGQQKGYGQPMQYQPDPRGQVQAQSATFEMPGDVPPPDEYDQGYDDGYGRDQYNQAPGGGQPARNYGGYNAPPQQNGFQPPPRSQSAAGVRPGPGFSGGLPSGPKGAYPGLPNGPSPNDMPRRTASNEGGLPSHPPPVRAGLIPNSVAAQANNKPPPVRNYNSNPPLQQSPAPSGPDSMPAASDAAPVTDGELNMLRDTVKANPADQATTMILVRRLVEASEVLVPLIPDQRARNKARERYIMDAHKLLKKLVAVQNTEAMFYLADCYGRGALGLETDNKEAFTLYQSAAKAGHAAAAYRTAVCCELGNEDGGGTRKDPLKAIQWYKRAATLGDTPAMYKMGIVQLKGLLGQQRNPREAVIWLKRAAERADAENPHALHELALLFEQPQGPESSVIHDELYSFQLFRQAADLGYKFSQFRLGCAFEYGLFNCPIDPRQSIMWYSRAAAQEEHQSELALSGWYLTGSEGVLQQSDTEAYLWARKAAMAGLAKAEYAMGYFTEVGIGAPGNLEDAKRWYWRAAAQNFPKARERLEDLKRGGAKANLKSRERISRSKKDGRDLY